MALNTLPSGEVLGKRALHAQSITYQAQSIVRLAAYRSARGALSDSEAADLQYALDVADQLLDSAAEAMDSVTLTRAEQAQEAQP